MKPAPLVTILIPTYNQERYVASAIHSALAQDYERTEVVVSDDASTDGTEKVVKEFEDPRLHYNRWPSNAGRVANYRRGLYELATGDWVLNLDGDDVLTDSSFIRVAVQAGEADSNVSFVAADRYIRDDPLDVKALERRASLSAPIEYLDGTEYVLSLPRPRFRISHLSTIYRRIEALRTDFYRVDIVSSDYESLFRLAIGARICHIGAYVGVWRRHPMNASTVQDPTLAIANLDLFKNVYEYGIEKCGPTRRRDFDRWLARNIENRLYASIVSYFQARDFRGLRSIAMFVRQRYPLAWRRTFLDPRVYLRGLLALAGLKKAMKKAEC